MNQDDSGLFFRIGVFAIGLLFLTSPLWKPKAEAEERASEKPVRSAAPGESLQFRHMREDVTLTNREEDEKVLRRQLHRHAMNTRNGFYQNVVENPDMPIEVRERFAVEKKRLEQLAREHPELATSIKESMPPQQVDENGAFTEEFKKAVHNMKTYGVWDQMVDDHVENLIRDANNPDIPEAERPTPEQIERFRSQRLVPVL